MESKKIEIIEQGEKIMVPETLIIQSYNIKVDYYLALDKVEETEPLKFKDLEDYIDLLQKGKASLWYNITLEDWVSNNYQNLKRTYNEYNNIGKPSQAMTLQEWHKESFFLKNRRIL